jgi:transcriptional regulator with XRE-family HTH domain
MNLREIGLKVAQRRIALGLSQDRLAKLCGLSRSTIHHLEAGTLNDLGATKLFSLLSLLGLSITTHEHKNRHDALAMASQTASVSFKSNLKSTDLSHALAYGDVPDNIYPHIASFLDEAPLDLIISAVAQDSQLNQVQPKAIWKNIYLWASEMHSPRPAWYKTMEIIDDVQEIKLIFDF